MHETTCVVIGGGQSGLAMSRCLTDLGLDHVVLERGRVAERWRSERWDSLRLLTPNWQSRLPGFRYDGSDPDGYMTMPEVIRYFERYAASFGAPVREGVQVRAVSRARDAFLVRTDEGTWRAPVVVVATGHSDRPFVPPVAARFPAGIQHVIPTRYRRPADLPEGGVLVVGASATGVQLADEIHRSGRRVTIAVGRHTRLPRVYRGRDILWWLDRMGLFDETLDQVKDPVISREQPSLQLVGHPNRTTLDLAGLAALGVRAVGRLLDVRDGTARFDDDLVATTAAADVKLAALLVRIDTFISRERMDAPPAPPFEAQCLRYAGAATSLSLAGHGIASVVWATGFTRAYPWLQVPVVSEAGEIRHQGGITPEPGLYVLGLHFLRRRKSAFIDGVGDDARVLAGHVAAYVRGARPAVA
jgi:putative flavoprotein involved in K+ transport